MDVGKSNHTLYCCRGVLLAGGRLGLPEALHKLTFLCLTETFYNLDGLLANIHTVSFVEDGHIIRSSTIHPSSDRKCYYGDC